MERDEITLTALARAHRDAADALEHGSFLGQECCGIPLSLLGKCQHRPGHPTIANVEMTSYPEFYEIDGRIAP